MMRSIVVDRPQFKFSAAHMTVFPDGSKEHLHGHNYQLGVELFISDVSPSVMCDFAVVKDALKFVCAELNERTLVALQNNFLIVTVDGKQVRLSHRDGDYLLPKADCALLPLDNISSERLAEYCHAALSAYLVQKLPTGVLAIVANLEVRLFELPGQGATYRAPLTALATTLS